MKTRAFYGLILSAALVLALAGAGWAAPVGQFIQVEGRVDVMRGGNLPALEVKIGDGVEKGDAVRTKCTSRAQIKFIDDTTLNIAPESRVAIEEYMYDAAKGERQAVIQVFRGLVETVVSKVLKTDKPDFIMKTHTAVMGVRGTKWYTSLSPQFTDIYQEKGCIKARNLFAEVKAEVTICDMQFSRIGMDLAPTVPVPITKDDLLFLQTRINVPKGQAAAPGTAAAAAAGAGYCPPGGSDTTAAPTPPAMQTTTAANPSSPSLMTTPANAIYIAPPAASQPPPPPPSVVTTPFYIQTQWGAGGVDLDLHLTGPDGSGTRFHVYYANTGSTSALPFARLNNDWTGASGSETITVQQLTQGGVYRASVFNYGNQSFTSTNLSTNSGVSLQVINGGTVTNVANGTTITGGTTLTNLTPTPGLAGNTWRAVEINPATRLINPVNQILNSANSASVQ